MLLAPTTPQSGRAAFQQRTLSTTLLQVEQSAVECAGPIDLPAATRGGATSLLSSTHGDHFYPLSLCCCCWCCVPASL